MKIPVTNNTAMPIYVAGMMVAPGDTRHFDEDQVPDHFKPAAATEPVAAAEPADEDPLIELIQKSVKDIVPQLAALTNEQLAALAEAENHADGGPRKTLIEAITATQLDRAAAKNPQT